jgi:hypothetical protein
MDQQTKEQYIAHLMSAPWQDIKDEAELYGVEKEADDKWKDLIPAIADAKFADPVVETSEVEVVTLVEELQPEDKEFLDADLVSEEPEVSSLSFDYVKEGGLFVCPVCNYPVRTDMDLKTKICPLSKPECPRPSPGVN